MTIIKGLWLKKTFDELGIKLLIAQVLFYDNQGVDTLAKHLSFHSKIKHVGIYFYFIRKKVLNREICMEYMPIEEQNADIMTKSLRSSHFVDLRTKLIVVNKDMSWRKDVKMCDKMDGPMCNMVYLD